MKHVLMVLTSHDRLGDTGQPTGFWLEEFDAPYYAFVDAGLKVALASPRGGQPPLDPKSAAPDFQTEATRRFEADAEAKSALARTLPLSSVSADDYDAVFYPGGHGPLWDLAQDNDSLALVAAMAKAGKVVAAVCHGPAALLRAEIDGVALLKGRAVTGFTNSEEAAVGLTEIVPFSIEDGVGKCGGRFVKGADWASHVVTDGCLVTGQNPGSSAATATAVVALL